MSCDLSCHVTLRVSAGMEWFTASLVVPQDTAGLGVTSWFDSTANVTIMDNDRMTVYCDSSTYVTTEEAGNVTMTVVVDGNFAVPFNVTVTPEADSAEGKLCLSLRATSALCFSNTVVDYQMSLFPSLNV